MHYYINIVIFFARLHPHHLDILCRLLGRHLLFLHLCYTYQVIFYHMIKLSVVLTRWMRWVLKIMCKMSSFVVVIKNNLSMTSTNSSSSFSSSALESSKCCICALFPRPIFFLHLVGRGPIDAEACDLEEKVFKNIPEVQKKYTLNGVGSFSYQISMLS